MRMNEKVKLAIAPIAWTNDDMPELGKENTFEQCISEMALAGFIGTEIGNKYPDDPAILKKALDLRGLTICNAWFSTFFTSEPPEVTVNSFKKKIDFLYRVGARIVGVSEQGNSIQGNMDLPVLSASPVFTAEEWQKVSEGMNQLGRIAEEKGMTLTYHHHMGTGIQTMEEIDQFMEMTDQELVFLLYDTGHAGFSDIDPLKLVEKYIRRIKHIHLKDIRKDVFEQVKEENMSFLRAVKAGVFTVPGDGMIEFKPIFEVLAEYDYQGWMVVEAEQDPTIANPLEYALKARDYIKENTGL